MAESAEVGSGTIVSKELSDPIRSHKDVDQDAVPFYHKAVKFCEGLANQLVDPLLFLFVYAYDPVGIAVMVVGVGLMTVGMDGMKAWIAKTFHDIKISWEKGLVEPSIHFVVIFDVMILCSIFVRAIWRYLLSFQFMRSLYLQLHLPWTFEFRLPLIFGFQRAWTIPAFGIDFLEQIFTNDPADAPPTWVFDTVLHFNIAAVLFLAVLFVLFKIYDLYLTWGQEAAEAGSRSEFEFPIVQDPLDNPGGSRSWMQEESVALEEIAIWEGPVDHLRLFYPGGNRKGSGVFKHNFIVIKLACGEFFTVEKVAKPGKHVKFTRGNETQGGVTRRFSMELKGATVPVVELGRVLGEEGRRYDFLTENCWFYAIDTTKRVIKLCGEDPDLETEKIASLLKDLEQLKKAERTDPDSIVGMVMIGLPVLFVALMAVIEVTSEYKPWWLRWLRRFLQCDKPYWNPHSKLT